MKFAELNKAQEAFAEGMIFDSMIITKPEIELVRKAYELDGMNLDELQAMRNAVVRYLAGIATAARENGLMIEWEKLHNNMSAITCVIDNEIYKHGGMF